MANQVVREYIVAPKLGLQLIRVRSPFRFLGVQELSHVARGKLVTLEAAEGDLEPRWVTAAPADTHPEGNPGQYLGSAYGYHFFNHAPLERSAGRAA